MQHVASFCEVADSSSCQYRNKSFIPESGNLTIPHLASYKVNSADIMSVLIFNDFYKHANEFVCVCIFMLH
jgi:hypothetical protein